MFAANWIKDLGEAYAVAVIVTPAASAAATAAVVKISLTAVFKLDEIVTLSESATTVVLFTDITKISLTSYKNDLFPKVAPSPASAVLGTT